jgi:hypothetical protein
MWLQSIQEWLPAAIPSERCTATTSPIGWCTDTASHIERQVAAVSPIERYTEVQLKGKQLQQAFFTER